MSSLLPTVGTTSCLTKVQGNSSCILSVQQPLFPCVLDDCVAQINTTTAILLSSFSPVSIYGSVGFEKLYKIPLTESVRPLWKQCDEVMYCEGPQYIGQTFTTYELYTTRWKCLYQDSLFFLGVVGQNLDPVSSIIFPTTYNCERFSFCFEQVGLPVFALDSGSGTIELRRLVIGQLFTLVFAGSSPALFLNALLQPDTNQQDVVVYYLRSGNLYSRYQRDNFGVEYLLITAVGLTELKSVRAYRGQATPFEYLIGNNGCSTRLLLSGTYPFWPVYVVDTQPITLSLRNDGSCDVMVLVNGPYPEFLSTSIALNSDGVCDSWVIIKSESDSANTALAVNADGLCYQVVLVSSPYLDAANTTLVLNADGLCYLVVISGGTYVESSQTTLTLNSDGDCSTV